MNELRRIAVIGLATCSAAAVCAQCPQRHTADLTPGTSDYTQTITAVGGILKTSSGTYSNAVIECYGTAATFPLMHIGGQTPDPEEQTLSSGTIERLWRNHERIPLMIRGMGYEDIEVRKFSSRYLASLGNDAVRPLIKALRSSNWHTRANAAITLGTIRDQRAVSPLRELLNDKNPEVSSRVAYALELLDEGTPRSSIRLYLSATTPFIGFVGYPIENLRRATINLDNLTNEILYPDDQTKIRRQISSVFDDEQFKTADAHQQIIIDYLLLLGDLNNENPRQATEMSLEGIRAHLDMLPAPQRSTDMKRLQKLVRHYLRFRHWPLHRSAEDYICKIIAAMTPQIENSVNYLANAYDLNASSNTTREFLAAAAKLEKATSTNTKAAKTTAGVEMLRKLELGTFKRFMAKFPPALLAFKELNRKLGQKFSRNEASENEFQKNDVPSFTRQDMPLSRNLPKELHWYLYFQQAM